MREKLALEGGRPVRSSPVPAWPVFDEREVEAVAQVVRSGKWGMQAGEQVKRFQEEFTTFVGARHGVCVVNGTAALEIAMRAMGLGPGDEVITPAYTFIATPNAALLLGAAPVFVDIDPDTYLLDPGKIEEAITEHTRAIMPVHYAGQPADMDRIMDIARRHRLFVVEDACQAWGAEWRGHPVGTIGNVGTFSFQSSKNINAGEGGMVVTNDDALDEIIWSLHNVGRRRSGEWYEHVRVGWNYRMTEFQAAILRVQLSRFPEQTATRDRNARYLQAQLAHVAGVKPLAIDPGVTRHAWHIFVLRYQAEAFGGLPRAWFIDALRAEGIPCGLGYLPLTRSQAIVDGLQALRKGKPRPCPIAERACDEEAVLLTQNLLLGTREDMDSIVEAIAKIQRAKGV